MGNGLSQNEIDALLAGVGESELSSENGSQEEAASFDLEQSDKGSARREMKDIEVFLEEALESSLNILSQLTETEVSLSNLRSGLKDSDNIVSGIKGKIVTVAQNIKGALNGNLLFIFEETGALKLVEKMLDQEETVLSEIALSTLGENFNQFLNSIYTWIEGKYKKTVEGEIPRVEIFESALDLDINSKQSVEVPFTLSLGDINLAVTMVLPVTVSKEIINLTVKGGAEETSSLDSASQEEKQKARQVNARPVQFSRLDTTSSNMPLGNIEILLDVSMQVTVELGRTKMRIREILGLGEGSIIELQKLAGEPVDILVNGKLIAKGEVVVIDEYFGVRITEIISPSEMMNLMSGKDEF